jgi:hypothetical protein
MGEKRTAKVTGTNNNATNADDPRKRKVTARVDVDVEPGGKAAAAEKLRQQYSGNAPVNVEWEE